MSESTRPVGHAGHPPDRRIASDVGPFAIVPEWMIDADVSDRAFRLYSILSRYADGDGFCWPSRRTLADRLRCSVDTLDRTVRELVDGGMLTVAARVDDAGDRASNGYTIHRVAPAPMQGGGRTPAATGGRTDAATGGRTGAALTRAIVNESQMNEMATPGGVAASTSGRARDVVWDALLAVCGIDPDGITSASRGAYNRAAKDLRSLNVTAEDIARRAIVYRRRWPDVSLTPTALVRRWPECDPTTQHSTRPPLLPAEQESLGLLVDAWQDDRR